VTGNREAAAHVKSHRAKLNRFFSLGGYGMPRTAVSSPDRHLPGGSGLWRRGAPSPVPGHRGYPPDAAGAHASGIKCVGVASHKFPRASSQQAGPTMSSPRSKKDFPYERADSAGPRAGEEHMPVLARAASGGRCQKPAPARARAAAGNAHLSPGRWLPVDPIPAVGLGSRCLVGGSMRRPSLGSRPARAPRRSPGRPPCARRCCGLLTGQERAQLSDGAHQRCREHDRGVLVDTELHEGL
jgi:hypothetical protein